MDFYEFFAGGGMARLGLGPEWRCLFANDLDATKAACYRQHFQGAPEYRVDDIADIRVADLPGRADLAWASFPCQDLSLAGAGAGLDGRRSGTFWTFWRLVQGLGREGRAPRAVVLENVRGAVTSHQGRDLAAICRAMGAEGYAYAPLVMDAARFLPQSRPRLFIIGFGPGARPPRTAENELPAQQHPESFCLAYDGLTPAERASWVWLRLPVPPRRTMTFADVIEEEPVGVKWRTAFETNRLLNLMSPLNLAKVEQAKRAGRRVVGTVYRRTRRDASGARVQRAEARFDGLAGCLRTPAGGSSRQTVLVVEGGRVRSRLLSPREAARLMGLPEDYPLPARANDAYRLVGDGVAVPVVSWLARHVLEPALAAAAPEAAA